jgi:hypothetical protein
MVGNTCKETVTEPRFARNIRSDSAKKLHPVWNTRTPKTHSRKSFHSVTRITKSRKKRSTNALTPKKS